MTVTINAINARKAEIEQQQKGKTPSGISNSIHNYANSVSSDIMTLISAVQNLKSGASGDNGSLKNASKPIQNLVPKAQLITKSSSGTLKYKSSDTTTKLVTDKVQPKEVKKEDPRRSSVVSAITDVTTEGEENRHEIESGDDASEMQSGPETSPDISVRKKSFVDRTITSGDSSP